MSLNVITVSNQVVKDFKTSTFYNIQFAILKIRHKNNYEILFKHNSIMTYTYNTL